MLDVVPGAGAAGDGIKAAGKVGDFIVKFAGDAAKVGEALLQTAKHFPKTQEMMPLLGKIIPSSTLDNMSYAIAQGTPITKAECEAIQELGEAAGKKMGDVGPWYSKVGDEIVEGGSNSANLVKHRFITSRINIANGPTRFSPSKKAGLQHVIDRHFSPGKNAGQFTISVDELKEILKKVRR